MQNRNVGKGLRTTSDRAIEMTESDLVGRIGYGLIGRRTRSAYTECLHAFWKQRHQRDFASDVRRDYRRNHGSEYERLNFISPHID